MLAKKIFNSKGQALTEYVLFLFLVLAMAFGVLYQFNSAFRVFAEGYFGDYLSCLLETGELPNLGTTNTSLQCDAAYEPFSLAKGRPYQSKVPASANVGVPPPRNDRSGSTGQDTSTTANTSRSQQTQAPNVAAGGGQSESGGSGSSGQSSQFYDNTNSSSGRTRDVPINAADSTSKGKNPSLTFSGGDGTNNQQQGSGEEGRMRYFEANGYQAEADGLRKRTIDAGESRSSFEGKRVPAESEAVNKKGPTEDEGLSLPDFLRYLLIAGIVIALVIFFGGQVLQFSKSQE